ncbi:MAG: glycerol-3-phosphate acyltransferase PlsX [Candidatus Saganbacteria bacterium]|uniref:Phosphate acyltransferase n=1 Tax=Candidatus Saganbacteria bacterium TaxID=2575572 RepID=A0A833NYE5_UNCSA|nr:MAG: glycerol-3-phosphate acyltransferase PlsX [Candidatus Saganbacteria bacterium]
MINIAVDAMGGDFAPDEIIKGACQAAGEYPDIAITLVGKKDIINKALKCCCSNISVVNAAQTIGMNESPVLAVREKKDASINVALQLAKEKKVDAVVSAGNTGAFMAAALFKLGRISGIERPAIAAIFPTANGRVLCLDMGANSDNRPKHLKQFAEMGSVYAEKVMHIKSPRVGLLNIGEEPEKGNELTLATYPLLKGSKINFIGMIESKEIISGKLDVVVCDGFIGNVILKFGESVSSFIIDLIKKELSRNAITWLAAAMMLPVFFSIKKKVDYDESGGAPFLGVDGICIKAHGRARAKAIKNAVRVAYEAVKEDIVKCIKAVEVA